MTSVPALASSAVADDLKDKQNGVRKQLKSAQHDLEDSSRAHAAARGQLNAAQAKLGAAEQRLAATQSQLGVAQRQDAQMQAKLQAAQLQLKEARAAVAKIKAEVREQRADIGRLAAENYQHGDPALLRLVVILNSQSPEDITSQMNTVSSLMEKQNTLLRQLKEARARLVLEEAKVEEAKNAVEVQRQAAAANLVQKQVLERQAVTDRTAVAGLVNERHQAEVAAEAARRADLKELKILQAQEARIKQLILARARKQQGGFVGNTGGVLLRPVPGIVTSPYGYRTHPIYGYYGLHDGTDFRAGCGTPLRAVADGTVISTYYSSVWGNRLYLDVGRINGKNVTVIYNHLSGYRASTGQKVSRGSTVGLAGTTGWSTACHLHFTVMLDGDPVNPMNYM